MKDEWKRNLSVGSPSIQHSSFCLHYFPPSHGHGKARRAFPASGEAFRPPRAGPRPAGRTPVSRTPARSRRATRRHSEAMPPRPLLRLRSYTTVDRQRSPRVSARRQSRARNSRAPSMRIRPCFSRCRLSRGTRTASFTRGFCRLVIIGVEGEERRGERGKGRGEKEKGRKTVTRRVSPITCCLSAIARPTALRLRWAIRPRRRIAGATGCRLHRRHGRAHRASYRALSPGSSRACGRSTAQTAGARPSARGRPQAAAADVSTTARLHLAARGRSWADRGSGRHSGCRGAALV